MIITFNVLCSSTVVHRDDTCYIKRTQIILYCTVITEYASPPEKRQMVMVSGAFNHLCDKLTAGEVSSDVLQKLTQLVGDLSVRNFASAGAIQTVRNIIN